MSIFAQYNRPIGRIRRKNIKCVLQYQGRLYLVYRKSLMETVVLCVTWDRYHGFTQTDESPAEKIYYLANKLADMHMENADRYPMQGEWYAIREHYESNGMRLGIQRIRTAAATTRGMFISLALQFLLAMAIVTAMLYFTKIPTVEWMRVLYPETARATLLRIYIAAEYMGCTLLFFAFKSRRGFIPLLCNTLVPFCIIISIGLANQYWWMILVFPVAAIVAGLIGVLWSMYFEERDDGYPAYVRSALIVCGVVLICFSNYFAIYGYPHAEYKSEISDMSDKQALYHTITLCERLDKDAWATLDMQERTELLQAISDYECIFILGCEPVKVQIGATSSKDALGEYNHITRQITIKEEHLLGGDVEYVLNTLLHETRHVYQRNLVDMYFSIKGKMRDEYQNLLPFLQAQEYAAEFDDYHYADEDFDLYYSQVVERDSRNWAEKRFNEFYFSFFYPNR